MMVLSVIYSDRVCHVLCCAGHDSRLRQTRGKWSSKKTELTDSGVSVVSDTPPVSMVSQFKDRYVITTPSPYLYEILPRRKFSDEYNLYWVLLKMLSSCQDNDQFSFFQRVLLPGKEFFSLF